MLPAPSPGAERTLRARNPGPRPGWRLAGAVVAGLACLALAAAEAAAAEAVPAVPAATVVKDTRHYHFESDASPERCTELGEELESLHAYLERQFAGHIIAPPAPMRVRFFKERDGLLAYAAASCPDFKPGWFGYYSFGRTPADGELVAYDLGANHMVLYHEAFHQFMHRAYPAIRSYPQWFNEGMADVIGRGRLEHGDFTLAAAIDQPDLGLVRSAIKDGSALPLPKLLELDLRAWNGEHMLLHYAEGYLFIIFLLSPGDERRAGLLPAFFSELSKRQDYPAAFAVTLGAYGVRTLEGGFARFLAAEH